MKSAVKTALRIGRINYTNTLPFFHDLEMPTTIETQYYSSYPSRVNLAMRKGHVHHYPDGASASKNLHYGVTIEGPDYERLGEQFGFPGHRVEKLGDLNGALTKALGSTKQGKTAILNVVLSE